MRPRRAPSRAAPPSSPTRAPPRAAGLVGFLVFFVVTFALSAMLYLKMGGEPKPYFKVGGDIWTEGIQQALMSYILFWTLFYDIVHIY